MTDDPVVIVAGDRTAIGRFGGSLKDVEACELGAACIVGAVERAGIDPTEVMRSSWDRLARSGRMRTTHDDAPSAPGCQHQRRR